MDEPVAKQGQANNQGSPGLRRTLGLGQVTLSGIGVILGAGVYALVGPASGQAGNALWLAFLISGVVAGLTAYSYARLGMIRPKDSAEFQYTSIAFGPRVGLVAGWLMVTADLLAAAAVSLGFGNYFSHFLGLPIVASAFLLLAALGILLYTGIGESVGVAIVLTFVEVAGLLFVIAIGLPMAPQADLMEMPTGLDGVWAAAALVLFAYLGFDELGNLAEEMKQPERILPRALFLSVLGSTTIYILVAVAAVAAVGWRDLSSTPAPLALVAGRALGPNADTAVSLMALAATANTALLLLVSASRSLYGMGSARVLPAFLSRVGQKRVPTAASGVVLASVGMLLLLEDLARVAALTNATVLLGFMLVNVSLLSTGVRGTLGAAGVTRLLDCMLPALGLLLCGWVWWHTGTASIAVAVALALVGWIIGSKTTKTSATDVRPPA